MRLESRGDEIHRDRKAQDGQEDEGRIDTESVRKKSGDQIDGGSGKHLNVGDDTEGMCLITFGNAGAYEGLEGRIGDKKRSSEKEKADNRHCPEGSDS